MQRSLTKRLIFKFKLHLIKRLFNLHDIKVQGMHASFQLCNCLFKVKLLEHYSRELQITFLFGKNRIPNL